MTLLTFNSRLRAFATWTLVLSRKSDGRFYGQATLRHCFETAVDHANDAGQHRFYIDAAMLCLTIIHILWLLDEVLLIRSMRLRQGVRHSCFLTASMLASSALHIHINRKVV